MYDMNSYKQKAKLLLIGLFLIVSQVVYSQNMPEATVGKPLKHELLLTGYSNYFMLADVINSSVGLEWVVNDQKRKHMFAVGVSYGWGLWERENLSTVHAESPYFVYGIHWGKRRIQPEFNFGLIWPRDPGFGFFLFPIITGGARYYAAKSPLMLRAGVGTGGLVVGLGFRIHQNN